MLDYRLRLWAPTSASRAISAVAELLVSLLLNARKVSAECRTNSEFQIVSLATRKVREENAVLAGA